MNPTNDKVRRNGDRIWGWILVILGGLFTLFCILVFLLSFSSADSGQREGGVFFGVLALVIGIPLLVIGIWLILRKGKTPTANLGGSNNLQGEVKNEH